MRFATFLLDDWLNHYKYADPPIQFDLASSTGPTWTLRELLELDPNYSVRAYSRITDEWIDPPREIIVAHVPGRSQGAEDHIGAAEAPINCLPQVGEGSLAALAPFTPLALKPRAEGTRSGGARSPQLLELQTTQLTSHVATETESSQEAPNKLNANRKSGLLANVANH